MKLLETALREIAPADNESKRQASERIKILTMPLWALGRVCDIGVKLAGIYRQVPPPTGRRCIVTMAGDHGIVEEKVAIHSPDVTRQMVANIIAGGAGVSVLGRLNHARLVVADLGMAVRDEELVKSGKLIDANVGKGTANFAKGPAMNREQAILAVEKGIAIARDLAADTDVFGTGEMGIGNTTPATAIVSTFTGLPVSKVCGAGAGLDQKGVAHKTKVIERALALNRPNASDALDVLAKVGGYEIGGIAGLVLGAAACRKAVLVDGFISTSGAMIAKALCPAVMDYVFLSHASAEPGHIIMCEWMGEKPLLDLGMRLGEGTGAAMAMNILEASSRILGEMATFDSAGVDGTPKV